jgi:acetyl-CoA synthetase
MEDVILYPVTERAREKTLVTNETYQRLYEASVRDPVSFWEEHGQRIEWFRPYSKVRDVIWSSTDVSIKWYEDGQLNACYNCVDRHLDTRGDQPALIWEGDEPDQSETWTYRRLHEEVCKTANVLKKMGAKKGDVISLYMPMIPQAVVAMLACARIGAVHSVIFGGFSARSITTRLNDGHARFIITADEGIRGSKHIPLKKTVDESLSNHRAKSVEGVLVYRYTGKDIDWQAGRDWDWKAEAETVSSDCPPEVMNAEDPLFILYTSGSTGIPKGVLHTTGGYMVYASMTHEYIFDYRPGEVFWCTADVGWITGHSYIVYGPLANGGTTLVFEGVPTYPDVTRMAKVVDKHKVSVLYTAPTAIRGLMADAGIPFGGDYSGESLRLLGSVGEPINPEAWRWYHEQAGKGRCPIVDTWWQTETGGILIAPMPGATDLKPGSATRPFFGIEPALLDDQGQEIEGPGQGTLVIKGSWPGQMRTVYRNHTRFIETYFKAYDGYYFSGDGAMRDEDGYYWITGRVDDTINVSGHLLGTAEIESALVLHPGISEAAVVGFPHDLKGQGIYCYVSPMHGTEFNDDLRQELLQYVRKHVGPLATPDVIQCAPGLPKTRSGKIMRRILRKIAEGEFNDLGDTTTLADPSVVREIINSRADLNI